MPDYCQFLNRAGQLTRKVHVVKRQPSKYWLGVTWCGRRGESDGMPSSANLGFMCRRCLKELRRAA